MTNTVDQVMMRELELYVDNNYSLYQRAEAIMANLERKVNRGVYDSSKAPKLWQYMIDEGARMYCKEFGGQVRYMFPKVLREELSKQYAEAWEEDNV